MKALSFDRKGIHLRGSVILTVALLVVILASANAMADESLQVVLKKTYDATPAEFSLAPFSSSSQPLSVAWSSDGKTLAALSNYGVTLDVWDTLGDGHKSFPIKSRFTNNALAFLNGEEIIAPSIVQEPGNKVWALSVWNPLNGAFVKGIPSQDPDRNDWWYNVFSLSADKSMLVALAPAVSGEQKLGTSEFGKNPVPIYSTHTWEILNLIKVVAPVSAAFSPDGKQVAFGDYKGLLSIYDTATGQPLKSIHPFEAEILPTITSLEYSPDGKFIVIGSVLYTKQKNTHPVRVVQISDGKVTARYSQDLAILKVVWSPDGKYIAFAPHDKTLRIWNPHTPDDPGVIIRNFNSMCVAFSPDSRQLAACDGTDVKVFDIKP